MESNWDKLKPELTNILMHLKMIPYDGMKYVGRFVGDWKDELQQTIDNSKEITWRNRNPIDGTSKEIDAEEYDLKRSGASADLVPTNLEYELLPFKKMTDALHLLTETRKQYKVEYTYKFPDRFGIYILTN